MERGKATDRESARAREDERDRERTSAIERGARKEVPRDAQSKDSGTSDPLAAKQ